MHKKLIILTALVIALQISFLDAMHPTALAQNPSKITSKEDSAQAILKLFRSLHAKNDTKGFTNFLTEKLTPNELAPIWPELMKLSIYHLPRNENIPAHNPQFSQILNKYSKKHESFIHKAARKGALVTLNTFLNKETLNSQNLNGETPLFTAVFAEELVAVKTLLNAGADPLIEVSLGISPLHVSNNVAITQLLCAHGARAHLDRQDAFGQTPLFHSVQHSSPEVTAFLIDQGAQVNIPNMCGETVLHGTSTCDMLKLPQALFLSKKLLEAGANVNAQCNDLATPLHFAAEDKLAPLVHLFLTHGADTTLKDRWGRTGASLIQSAWGITPQEFVTIYDQPNGKEILSLKTRAIAQKSFEYTPPVNKVIKQKNKTGKNKKKNKRNFPTFNQRKTRADAETVAAVSAQSPVTPPLVVTPPSPEPARKQALQFFLAERVTKWQNPEWLKAEKQKVKAQGVYEYWQFKRKKLYHRLPKKTLQTLFAHGKQEPRPNETHKGHMDTQYTLEGEMHFVDLNNPWNPGKQRQPGFYHMTRGIDNQIYHVGFKPIRNRGLQLGDFMQPEIPVLWTDDQTDTYSAVYDPNEGVRHVLLLK